MNLIKTIRKHWITCWMVFAMLLFFGVGAYITYSAYLGNGELKRVVSTKALTDIVFSSNIMQAPARSKNLHSNNTAKEYESIVTVCNFDQMTPAIHANEQITYNLVAELVQYDGRNYVPVTSTLYRENGTKKVFKIKKTGDNNSSINGAEKDLNSAATAFKAEFQSETLPGTSSFTDTFTLYFDREELSKESTEYFIQITATPEENTSVSGTIRPIQAQLSASKGKDYTSSWKGTLIEDDSTDYDAYNMQVTGSGAGTIEILWKTSYFDISDYFLADTENVFVNANKQVITDRSDLSNLIITDGVWSKVILKVDSTVQPKYDIQFYKNTSHTYTSSDPVSGYIKSGAYAKNA